MLVKIQNSLTVILAILCIWLWSSKDALQDKYNTQSNQLSEARTTIVHLNNKSISDNKINEANSRKIQSLINQSTKTQEQLKDAIQKSECANISLPDDVINILRERANSINSAIDTGQPN